MEGYCSTGQSPQRAVVPMEEEEEEEISPEISLSIPKSPDENKGGY
jgi:hypothetical protein